MPADALAPTAAAAAMADGSAVPSATGSSTGASVLGSTALQSGSAGNDKVKSLRHTLSVAGQKMAGHARVVASGAASRLRALSRAHQVQEQVNSCCARLCVSLRNYHVPRNCCDADGRQDLLHGLRGNFESHRESYFAAIGTACLFSAWGHTLLVLFFLSVLVASLNLRRLLDRVPSLHDVPFPTAERQAAAIVPLCLVMAAFAGALTSFACWCGGTALLCAAHASVYTGPPPGTAGGYSPIVSTDTVGSGSRRQTAANPRYGATLGETRGGGGAGGGGGDADADDDSGGGDEDDLEAGAAEGVEMTDEQVAEVANMLDDALQDVMQADPLASDSSSDDDDE